MKMNTSALWQSQFPIPHNNSHKYTRGHLLVMGGDVMTGAARLAARAAQRIGAGLVTLAAPAAAYDVYASALESVIVRKVESCDDWQKLAVDEKHNALLIGPGLGPNDDGRAYVLAALATSKPIVLDADALNLFEGRAGEFFAALHDKAVLTPHEGEFARLFGKDFAQTLARPERTVLAAKRAGCTVLLKGAETCVAAPDGRIVVNNNAPPWLATAGAGDVLAGMMAGLLAQGMPCFEAALASAWLHGAVATAHGPGLIAEDLVEGLPAQLKSLFCTGGSAK